MSLPIPVPGMAANGGMTAEQILRSLGSPPGSDLYRYVLKYEAHRSDRSLTAAHDPKSGSMAASDNIAQKALRYAIACASSKPG